MKLNPYLYFNGDAAEAIAFYENVFAGKADVVRYRDAKTFDPSYEIAPGTEDFVMHASLKLGDVVLMFCDVPADMPCAFSSGVQLMVSLDSEAALHKAFQALRAGGEVTMAPQKTFWSTCFGSVIDRFGIYWLLSYEEESH